MHMIALLLVGCAADKVPGAPDDSAGESGGETGEESGGDSSEPISPGPVVLAGGGSEGFQGDEAAWSARLYPHLWDAGDVTGDGLVTVAVLADGEESDWLPDYLVSLGADAAFNVGVDSREAAEDPALVDTFAEVDAVFLKGGDQGVYYDLWNDTVLEAQIRDVHQTRGGGVGGTSAGAMSMAEHALAGGSDLVTADVLEDALSSYLDDTDGGSGIHGDFLGFLPGFVVDTHFTQRARLGRLAGVMARAMEDEGLDTLMGVGCEEQTGVWIADGVATVVGVGAVSLLRADGSSLPQRAEGTPLTWAELPFDRLTDGWRFDVTTGEVDTGAPPEGAEAVAWDGLGESSAEAWSVDGDLPRHEERFAWVEARDPNPWSESEGSDAPLLADAIGMMDAFDSDRRGPAEEALFRGLYEHIGASGFLVGYGGSAERDEDQPDVVRLVANAALEDPPMASMIIDTSGVSWRSLSPEPSVSDLGDGSLHAAGLVGARLHILYTPASGLAWDTVARQVVSVE